MAQATQYTASYIPLPIISIRLGETRNLTFSDVSGTVLVSVRTDGTVPTAPEGTAVVNKAVKSFTGPCIVYLSSILGGSVSVTTTEDARKLKVKKVPIGLRKFANFNCRDTSLLAGPKGAFTQFQDMCLFDAKNVEVLWDGITSDASNLIGEKASANAFNASTSILTPVQGPLTVVTGGATPVFVANTFIASRYKSNQSNNGNKNFYVVKYRVGNDKKPEIQLIVDNTATTLTGITWANNPIAGDICYIMEAFPMHENATGNKAPLVYPNSGLQKFLAPGLMTKKNTPLLIQNYVSTSQPTGTCSSGCTTTSIVTNITTNYPNEHVGKTLKITSGAQNNQTGVISAHTVGTNTTFTIAAIAGGPSASDTLSILGYWKMGTWFAPYQTACVQSGATFTNPWNILWDTCLEDNDGSTANIVGGTTVQNTGTVTSFIGTAGPSPRLIVGEVENRTVASFIVFGSSVSQQLSHSDGFSLQGGGGIPYFYDEWSAIDMTFMGYGMTKQGVPYIRACRSGEDARNQVGVGARERWALAEYADYVVVEINVNGLIGSLVTAQMTPVYTEIANKAHAMGKRTIAVLCCTGSTEGSTKLWTDPASQTAASFNTERDTLFAWVNSNKSASPGDGKLWDYVIDTRPYLESSTGIWKAATVVASGLASNKIGAHPTAAQLRWYPTTDISVYLLRGNVFTFTGWPYASGKFFSDAGNSSGWAGGFVLGTSYFTIGSGGTFGASYANTTFIGAALTGNGVTVQCTAVAHGMVNGDCVYIQSVTGNTAANSATNVPWYVKFIDVDNFQLYSDAALTTPVVGNGAYNNGTGKWMPVPPPTATLNILGSLCNYSSLGTGNTGIHPSFEAAKILADNIDWTQFPPLYED